jgi:hypothetical protein
MFWLFAADVNAVVINTLDYYLAEIHHALLS